MNGYRFTITHFSLGIEQPALCGYDGVEDCKSRSQDDATCPVCVAMLEQPGFKKAWRMVEVERLPVTHARLTDAVDLLKLHLTPLRSKGVGAFMERSEAIRRIQFYLDGMEIPLGKTRCLTEEYAGWLIKIMLACIWELASEELRQEAIKK